MVSISPPFHPIDLEVVKRGDSIASGLTYSRMRKHIDRLSAASDSVSHHIQGQLTRLEKNPFKRCVRTWPPSSRYEHHPTIPGSTPLGPLQCLPASTLELGRDDRCGRGGHVTDHLHSFAAIVLQDTQTGTCHRRLRRGDATEKEAGQHMDELGHFGSRTRWRRCCPEEHKWWWPAQDTVDDAFPVRLTATPNP